MFDCNGVEVNVIDDLKTVRGLKIAHLNVRSLVDKINQVRVLLHNTSLDIFCVTEQGGIPTILMVIFQLKDTQLTYITGPT